jgi:hypothetical protein
MAVLTVATFNCEWRASGSPDAGVIRQRLLALNPAIICLTEAYRDFFGDNGHIIEADADYGYPIIAGRRKVLLWSQEPWRQVDPVGRMELSSGRFVAGTTATPIGDVRVAGVCIPWSKAHVDTGRRDRTLWEDHLAYLAALAEWLPAEPVRTLVMGDFNQRVPRRYQPQHVFDQLQSSLLGKLVLATAGDIAGIGKQAIDHVCCSHDLKICRIEGISNIGPDQRFVSDHFGVAVHFG